MRADWLWRVARPWKGSGKEISELGADRESGEMTGLSGGDGVRRGRDGYCWMV